MSSLKIAIQMDSPEILDKLGDSTFALIEEAIKKLYKVHIYTVDDLTLENNNPVVFCREVKSLDIKRKDFLMPCVSAHVSKAQKVRCSPAPTPPTTDVSSLSTMCSSTTARAAHVRSAVRLC